MRQYNWNGHRFFGNRKQYVNDGNLLFYCPRCALDIILETSMGFEMDIQHKRPTPYASAIANIVHIFQLRQFIPW